mgnify:CR=1 FL=1
MAGAPQRGGTLLHDDMSFSMPQPGMYDGMISAHAADTPMQPLAPPAPRRSPRRAKTNNARRVGRCAVQEPEEDIVKLEEPNVQKSKELELPCSHPGHIDHGLTDWNGTGREARFACYQGYYLVGPPKLVCR